MSVALSKADNLWPAPVATVLSLVALSLPPALFVIVAGPPALVARRLGWRLGRAAPVLFHRLLCASLGVGVRRHGTLSAAANQLIVANHVSWMDIPVLASLAPMSFLAKKEIGANLAGRELAALQGVVYVDRARRSCIPEVNGKMVETMRSGSPIVLFSRGDDRGRQSAHAFPIVAFRGHSASRRGRRCVHPADLSRLFASGRPADRAG